MSDNKELRRDDHQSHTPSRNLYSFINNKGNQPYSINTYKFSNFFFEFQFQHGSFKPHDIAVMWWLLEVANRSGWQKVLNVPTFYSMAATGIGNNKTLTKSFDKLAYYGFIDRVEKAKNQFTANKIEICRGKNEPAFNKALTKALNQQWRSIIGSTESALPTYINNINIETINVKNNKTIKMELYFDKKDIRNFETIDSSDQERIRNNLKQILNDNFDLLAKTDLSNEEYEIQLNEKEYEESFPANYSNKESELENLILDYFGISELNNYRLMTKVRQFLNYLGDNIKVFEENFFYYRHYKKMTGEHIHSLENFIGSPEQHYQDGAWCSVNFKYKLQQYENNLELKNNQNSKERDKTELNQGKIDVINRFLNENKDDDEEE